MLAGQRTDTYHYIGYTSVISVYELISAGFGLMQVICQVGRVSTHIGDICWWYSIGHDFKFHVPPGRLVQVDLVPLSSETG